MQSTENIPHPLLSLFSQTLQDIKITTSQLILLIRGMVKTRKRHHRFQSFLLPSIYTTTCQGNRTSGIFTLTVFASKSWSTAIADCQKTLWNFPVLHNCFYFPIDPLFLCPSPFTSESLATTQSPLAARQSFCWPIDSTGNLALSFIGSVTVHKHLQDVMIDALSTFAFGLRSHSLFSTQVICSTVVFLICDTI